MSDIIGKIAVLFGIGREVKPLARKTRKVQRVRRENDSITISAEARRLLAEEEKEGVSRHDGTPT